MWHFFQFSLLLGATHISIFPKQTSWWRFGGEGVSFMTFSKFSFSSISAARKEVLYKGSFKQNINYSGVSTPGGGGGGTYQNFIPKNTKKKGKIRIYIHLQGQLHRNFEKHTLTGTFATFKNRSLTAAQSVSQIYWVPPSLVSTTPIKAMLLLISAVARMKKTGGNWMDVL